MRVALISDIHANLPALLSVGELVRDSDRVICLGDLIGYYCQVNEVLDYVRELNATCILGNHDYFLLAGCPETAPEAVRFGIRWADRVISKEHRSWLAGLPLIWGGLVGGRSILAAHGSPWSPITDYLYEDSPKLLDVRAFDFDVVAFGQTHRPLLDRTLRPWLVNPGSIGQSRDAACIASFLSWETERMELELMKRAYDPAPVIELAHKGGAGNWIAKHLKA